MEGEKMHPIFHFFPKKSYRELIFSNFLLKMFYMNFDKNGFEIVEVFYLLKTFLYFFLMFHTPKMLPLIQKKDLEPITENWISSQVRLHHI